MSNFTPHKRQLTDDMFRKEYRFAIARKLRPLRKEYGDDLTDLERICLDGYFGYDGGVPTLARVAKEQEMDLVQVGDICRSAAAKLRKRSRIYNLHKQRQKALQRLAEIELEIVSIEDS